MLKKTTKRPPGSKDHATSTRTDARSASHKKKKEATPSPSSAFESIGGAISKFTRDAGDTAQRLAKSARVFSHTVRTESARPDKNLFQVIEDGFTDAAAAFTPKPDFLLLADEAEDYLDSIRHAAKANPKLKPFVAETETQYLGILGAGIASAVWDYQHDPESRPTAQRQAMDFADAYYRETPTEDSLDGLFATYAAVDRNVAKMRKTVESHTESIRNKISKIDSPIYGFPTSPLVQPQDVAATFLQSAERSHVWEKSQNAILEPLIAATEARVTALVQSTQTENKFYREAHLGIAHIHMGNATAGVRHLEDARMIFRDKGEVTPSSNDLALQIGILNRIAENSPEDLERAKLRLDEADMWIDILAADKSNRDKATLFRIGNMLRMLPHQLQEHEEDLQHNPDNVEDYHHAVAREHQKIINYCKRVTSKDPAIVALAHGQGMLQAAIQFEKRLDAAMSLRLTGEAEDARLAHVDAENKFNKNKNNLELTASPAFVQEAMGRMHWANATYTFKTGDVEQSLRDLRTLSSTYGDSGAAQILKEGSDEVWVHHYNIVDEHGNFPPDIGKPSQVAKWKKIADKLLDDKASATKAMMTGAGVAIVGAASVDALFGTHVIGGEALLTMGQAGMIGAGAGLLTERGYQVLSGQSEISSAYTTGIANVTTDELTDRGKALAGEVAVCFLAGGAARYVRMGVMGLGAGLRAPLLRGLLSEAGYVAEGIAFHEYAGIMHGTTDHSAMGFFRSFLTLRILGASNDVNFGALVFPNESFADAVMRHGVNSALANIPLQAFETTIARNLSGFGQGYFDSLFGLYAISVGSKVPETIMRAPQILAQAKASHHAKSAQKLIAQMDHLAKTEATLQSDIRYAETPKERMALTQQLVEAMKARAAALQGLARMELYSKDKANDYANAVETFTKIVEAAATPFESTPFRRRLAQALLLPVAPIFGTTGPIGGGKPKLPAGDVTQVGIKRGLGLQTQDIPLPPPETPPAVPRPPQRQRIPAPTTVFKPMEPAIRVEVELVAPEQRAHAQKLNTQLLTHGDEAAFATAGAENHMDSGRFVFYPQAPATFRINVTVDPTTGAIRSMGERSTPETATTITTSLTIFSPYTLAQLSAVHSEALRNGLHDRDPVPEWVLTKIGEIVEKHKEIQVGSTLVPTQFPKWFSFVNSRSLTLGEVFSDRVIKVFGERLPTEIETELQQSLIGQPFRTRDASLKKLAKKAQEEKAHRPGWMDDPRIASALWALNPTNAPDQFAVASDFRFNPEGDNELVYAILEISRAIAAGGALSQSYLNRLHHLLEAIPQHPDLFRPKSRLDTESTESNLDAHLRAAYAESPHVVLRALELLEEEMKGAVSYRSKLRIDFRATQPVRHPGALNIGPDATPIEDGLPQAKDAGIRRELRIREPDAPTPKPEPPQPADVGIIQHHSNLLATALNGNLYDIIPEGRYSRRDLTGFGESVVRARINAQTGEPLTLGMTPEIQEVEHTAVIDIRVFNGKVLSIVTNSDQLLHPDVLNTLRHNLIGKPARAKPLGLEPPDIQGSADPLRNQWTDQPARLEIVSGDAGKYPDLPGHQRPTLDSDSITMWGFRDALQDHFKPSYFGDVDLQKKRQTIVDRWMVREDDIDYELTQRTGWTATTSAATKSLYTTDAFLARTEARSETFVALLDLRIEAQLRSKLGITARLTDMDLESERNHILAEVLSEAIGAHLPIAKGTISVSTHGGVVVLRPEYAEDYASIDRVLQRGDFSSEALTGGFYCGKSAMGLPFIVINPNMGDSVWGVLRHEVQHLRKHASNRFEPHWEMPTPGSTANYTEALRQHFFIAAKDEILAYLEEAYPPIQTIGTLTRPGGLYDVITRKRSKIQLSDAEVAELKKNHFTYIAQQVWALNDAITTLVDYGYHPEAARREMIDRLSGIPLAQWESQLPAATKSLLLEKPQRDAPPQIHTDGKRAELRHWLENEVVSGSFKDRQTISDLALHNIERVEIIAEELKGTVSTDRLQELRRELQVGNTDLEQLAEVLHLMLDELNGRFQILQYRYQTEPDDVRLKSAPKSLKVIAALEHWEKRREEVKVYLDSSGLTKIRSRIDRLLLIRTAHSQKFMRDSADKTIEAPSPPIALPRIRGKDVSRMELDDQLAHILKLGRAMKTATSPDEMERAAGLYATFIRHCQVTPQIKEVELELLLDVAQAHPEWMPQLKYAFLGLSGAMDSVQWQKLLRSTIPAQAPDTTPWPTVDIGTKTHLINDIAKYRQQLKPFTQQNPHISRAITAIETALQDDAPLPRMVVRYNSPSLDTAYETPLHVDYFIVRKGKKALPPDEDSPTVVDIEVPLDRFVRFWMESNLRIDIDGKHITTTDRTNARFNQFLTNNYVRRHVTVQDGLLTPILVMDARREVITLEVRTKTDSSIVPDVAPPPHSNNPGVSASAARPIDQPTDIWAQFGGNPNIVANFIRASWSLGYQPINPDTGASFTEESLTSYIMHRINGRPHAPDLEFKKHGMNVIGGALLAIGSGGEQWVSDVMSAGPMVAGGVVMAGVAVGAIASRLYNRRIAAKQRAAEDAAKPTAHPDDIYLASLPKAEATALLAIPRDQWHDGGFSITRDHQLIRSLAQKLGASIDPDMLAYFAKNRLPGKMDYLIRKFIGSFSKREFLQAATHQYQLLHDIFETTPENKDFKKFDTPRHISINDHYDIAISKGFGESIFGIEFKLINRDDGNMFARIGFQETDDAIEVVRYQGGHFSQTMRGNFTKFSGGVEPMPWLSFVTGKLLLQRAQATGKELRWTAGERVRATYPHFPGVDYKGKTIEEARAFWSTPNPGLDEMGEEYDAKVKEQTALTRQLKTLQKTIGTAAPTDEQQQQLDEINEELGLFADLGQQYQEAIMWRRGTRTQQNYDTAAAKLGFEPHAGTPWNRLTDPSKFSRTFLDTAPDKATFDASTQIAAKALSVLTPFVPRVEKGVTIHYSGPVFVADLVERAWEVAIARLFKLRGLSDVTRAEGSRHVTDRILKLLNITPSSDEMTEFMTEGGLNIHTDKLTHFKDQLQALPHDLRIQLFIHHLIDPRILNTLESSGAFSRHGFEPTLQLLSTLISGDHSRSEKQLQSMGYGNKNAHTIMDAMDFHTPLQAADVLQLILPLPETDALTALNVAKDGHGILVRDKLKQSATIMRTAAQNGISLSPEELGHLTAINGASRMEIARGNSLGAVDTKMAMEAIHSRYQLLLHLFGDPKKIPVGVQHTIAKTKLNNRYALKLETGLYEAACGMQITLYEPDPILGILELGTIGFQESKTGIEVVVYQGANLSKLKRADSAAQFRKYSGGADPMPWLATAVGEILLTHANAQGKTLRWISGERIRSGYPHLDGQPPHHIHTVQDARGPWDGDPNHATIIDEYDALIASTPDKFGDALTRAHRLGQIEPYVKMFREGERRVARMYDTTAQNLGFRRKGNDAAWHRYTKSPANFGSAIRNGKGVDPHTFEMTVASVLGAMLTDKMFGKWVTSGVAKLELPDIPTLPTETQPPMDVIYSGAPWLADIGKNILDGARNIWNRLRTTATDEVQATVQPETSATPLLNRILGQDLVQALSSYYGDSAAARFQALEQNMGVVIEKVGKERLIETLEFSQKHHRDQRVKVSVLENLADGLANPTFAGMLGVENIITLSRGGNHKMMSRAVDWFKDYQKSGLSMELDAAAITQWIASDAGHSSTTFDRRPKNLLLYQKEINALPVALRTAMITNDMMNDVQMQVLSEKKLIQKLGFERTIQILVAAKTGNSAVLQQKLIEIGYPPENVVAVTDLFSHYGNSHGINRFHVAFLLAQTPPDVAALAPCLKKADSLDHRQIFDDLAEIRERATRHGVSLSLQEAAQLVGVAKSTVTLMNIAKSNTLGAIDERTALMAMLTKQKLNTALGTHNYSTFMPIGSPTVYHLSITPGVFEAWCGFQIELRDANGHTIATLGFQESDNSIDIVRYQGSRITPATQQAFTEFSGGLDPLQWLSLVGGDFLHARAQTSGKPLRWVSGDHVRMGYPHEEGGLPADTDTIESARAFWTRQHPEIEAKGLVFDGMVQERSKLREQRHLLMRKEAKAPDANRKAQIADINTRITILNKEIKALEDLVKMYRRGPHTQRQYDTAAQNLGFSHEPNAPWHIFSGTEFGATLRAKAAGATLDASLKLTTDAMKADPVFSKWMKVRGARIEDLLKGFAAEPVTRLLAPRPPEFTMHRTLLFNPGTGQLNDNGRAVDIQILNPLNFMQQKNNVWILQKLIRENIITSDGVVLKPEFPSWLRNYVMSQSPSSIVHFIYDYAKQDAVNEAVASGTPEAVAANVIKPTLFHFFVNRIYTAAARGNTFTPDAKKTIDGLVGTRIGNTPLKSRNKP